MRGWTRTRASDLLPGRCAGAVVGSSSTGKFAVGCEWTWTRCRAGREGDAKKLSKGPKTRPPKKVHFLHHKWFRTTHSWLRGPECGPKMGPHFLTKNGPNLQKKWSGFRPKNCHCFQKVGDDYATVRLRNPEHTQASGQCVPSKPLFRLARLARHRLFGS